MIAERKNICPFPSRTPGKCSVLIPPRQLCLWGSDGSERGVSSRAPGPSPELQGKCSRRPGLLSAPRPERGNRHATSRATHSAALSWIHLIKLYLRKIKNCNAALEASRFSLFNMKSVCLIQSVAGSSLRLFVAVLTTAKAHVPFLNLG